MIMRCIVAGTNANGEPDLYFVKVECNGQEYSEGKHYERAQQSAEKEDYEKPFVTFDENDEAGNAMLDLFEWNSASIVKV